MDRGGESPYSPPPPPEARAAPPSRHPPAPPPSVQAAPPSIASPDLLRLLPVQPPSSASPSIPARPSPRRAVAPSALAGDPDYLQDLCVADLNSGKLQPLPCTLLLHLCCSGTDPVKMWKIQK
ncbi:hypothetical protein PVAP13_6NG106506 [Panicum virgatum]|uniref:Uncharacterized protein n=1 Tax=Panicum virgatum TaxID=38727 RepID=A0A8T0QVP4_PANVG|nr:hypothetical protein PVAP13_6NG106506 [Panicum virgatum]